jgi:hypothetical protein
MSGETDFIFKIGIVGPTRVGKTSLIAAILKDGQSLLQGTPLSIKPFGKNTERRIDQHHTDLECSILLGEFNSGAVSGTEESFKYELHLDPGVEGAGIRFGLLDYPGGWIDAKHRPAEREGEWKTCENWMKESSVLIVPVESAVMMEGYSPRHKESVSHILNTANVAKVVREWAKNRAARPHEPALLIFCPVKCETYFADNGGLRDTSRTLFAAFQQHYRDVLSAVKDEAPQAKRLYMPVDTIGCVDIVKADWQKNDKDKELTFSADYRVRRPGRQTVKGADAVLVSLCRHLVDTKQRGESTKQREEALTATKMRSAAENATRHAEEDKGALGNFWLWISNEREARKKSAQICNGAASQQRQIVEGLDQIVEGLGQTIARLAQRELGSRVKEL